jgi:hypothetical protein
MFKLGMIWQTVDACTMSKERVGLKSLRQAKNMMALSARSSLNEAILEVWGFRGSFFYFGASMGPTVIHAVCAAANSPINVLRVR